jgi:hypothetical protein
LSARFIAGTVVLEGFEGGDDPVQVGLDAAQVLGEAELSLALGLFDETAVGRGLPPVDLQELGCGLEVRAGQAPLTELTTMFQQFTACFRSLPLTYPRDRIG